MSRSYRRTHNGYKKDWLPSYKNGGDDWFYWMTTPSQWNHDIHEKPMRAKTRVLVRKIKAEVVDPDEALFPVFKKPHIYFW